MYQVRKYNQISELGLRELPTSLYKIHTDINNPQAIILRSHKLKEEDLGDDLLAIGRAGAGVNNVPVAECTQKGIVVFNTPGANANAVKELVLAGLLISSRKIVESIVDLKAVEDRENIAKTAEKMKANYAGPEIAGKKLGIIGLGAIGVCVAQVATSLGMEVIGYDPYISVANAWKMPKEVHFAQSFDSLLAEADYITLHIPASAKTNEFINSNIIAKMKDGVRLLNFSRAEIVKVNDIINGINSGKIAYYVHDFADERLLDIKNVLTLPHLGASTKEAEENCAVMACSQLKEYLENGTIVNSVNFPTVNLKRNGSNRLSIIHSNIPKMIGQISDVIGEADINIIDMMNTSKDDIAYTLMDLNEALTEDILNKIKNLDGVKRVRIINIPH